MESNRPIDKVPELDGRESRTVRSGRKHATRNEMPGHCITSVPDAQETSVGQWLTMGPFRRCRYSVHAESNTINNMKPLQPSLTLHGVIPYEKGQSAAIVTAKDARQPIPQRFGNSVATSGDKSIGTMQRNVGRGSQSAQTNTTSTLVEPKTPPSANRRTLVQTRTLENLSSQLPTRGIYRRQLIHPATTRRSGRLLSAVIQSKTSSRKPSIPGSQNVAYETRAQARGAQTVVAEAQATAQLGRPFHIVNDSTDPIDNNADAHKTSVVATRSDQESILTRGNYIHINDTIRSPSGDSSTIFAGLSPTAYCFRHKHTPSSLFALINSETSKLRDAVIGSASEIRAAIGGPEMGHQIIDVEEANRVWSALNGVASLLEGVPQILEGCGEYAECCVCGRCSCLGGGDGARKPEERIKDKGKSTCAD